MYCWKRHFGRSDNTACQSCSPPTWPPRSCASIFRLPYTSSSFPAIQRPLRIGDEGNNMGAVVRPSPTWKPRWRLSHSIASLTCMHRGFGHLWDLACLENLQQGCLPGAVKAEKQHLGVLVVNPCEQSLVMIGQALPLPARCIYALCARQRHVVFLPKNDSTS